MVQLYISVPDPDGIQPRWSLKDFTRVTLNRGAATQVSFTLDRHALEQFDRDGKTGVLPGTYKVYVGNCSPGERGKELGAEVISASFQVL